MVEQKALVLGEQGLFHDAEPMQHLEYLHDVEVALQLRDALV